MAMCVSDMPSEPVHTGHGVSGRCEVTSVLRGFPSPAKMLTGSELQLPSSPAPNQGTGPRNTSCTAFILSLGWRVEVGVLRPLSSPLPLEPFLCPVALGRFPGVFPRERTRLARDASSQSCWAQHGQHPEGQRAGGGFSRCPRLVSSLLVNGRPCEQEHQCATAQHKARTCWCLGGPPAAHCGGNARHQLGAGQPSQQDSCGQGRASPRPLSPPALLLGLWVLAPPYSIPVLVSRPAPKYSKLFSGRCL